MELVESETDKHAPARLGRLGIAQARTASEILICRVLERGNLKTTGYSHIGYHDSVSGASDNSRRGGLRSGLQAPETPRSARFERACQTPDGADMKRRGALGAPAPPPRRLTPLELPPRVPVLALDRSRHQSPSLKHSRCQTSSPLLNNLN